MLTTEGHRGRSSGDDLPSRETAGVLAEVRCSGVTQVVFGDLFREALRRWREAKLADVGMRAAFPLWMRDTRALARAMIASGLRATLTCIDPRKLDPSFAGRSPLPTPARSCISTDSISR